MTLQNVGGNKGLKGDAKGWERVQRISRSESMSESVLFEKKGWRW